MKVYSYGILGRHQYDEEMIIEQMRLANIHYNNLVALEKKRRSIVDAIIQDDIAEEVEREADARKVLSHALDNKDKDATASARKELDQSRKELKKARNKALRERKQEVDEVNRHATAAGKILRSTCGCYWGTYLLAEDAAKASAKTMNPRFRRWNGEGAVGVLIKHGMSPERAFSLEDTRFRMVVKEPQNNSRRSRTRPHTEVAFRIGSDARKKPIWATFTIRMHRPLPEGCRIKRAKVFRKLDANIPRWELQITVDDKPVKRPYGDTDCAINLGWRIQEDGSILAATLVDENGEVERLILPEKIPGRFDRSDTLRGTRDDEMNRIRSEIMTLIDESQPKDPVLVDARRYMHLWKSPRRFVQLLRKLQSGEQSGTSEQVIATLEPWHKQDLHLWQWEARNRRKGFLHRREVYRVWARRIADSYRRIAVEDLNRSRVAMSAKKDLHPGARARRVDAAPSILVEALNNAAGKRLIKVDCKRISMTCPEHGTVEKWDRRVVEHTWACGCTYDQDIAAAEIMLGRLPEWSGDESEFAEDDQPYVGAWQRKDKEKE